tara:strand:+ start:423 stop:1841 length:1419 start_codon:yes stop_codon:yes gene_type:complete
VKKILINITNGFSLRYICHTGILKELSKKYKIILLSKNANSTKKNVEDDNIQYEQINEDEFNKFKFSNKIYNFVELLRYFIHGGKYTTPKNNFEEIFKNTNFFRKIFFTFLISLFNNIRFLRKLTLRLTKNFYPSNLDNLINKLSPDLVLTTSLGTFSFDEFILRAAKKKNIKNCAVILSWDNTTTRGYASFHPDRVISWTDIMKNELIKFHDVDEKKIYVGGVAHFDDYYNKKPIPKSKFFEGLNLDVNKNLITFFTKGPSTFQFNPNITKIICEAIQNSEINNSQLITRIHPLFYKNKNGKPLFGSALSLFEELNTKYKFLRINNPKILSYDENFDISREEQEMLINLIYHSDVIVNIFSTINIEACIFNKPIVNVNFDNLEKMYNYDHKKNWRQNLHKLDKNLDHNQRIVKSGSIKLANNPKELISYINDYLKNPQNNSNERKKIVDIEIGKFKGNASKNIASIIENFL